jgi:transposase
MAKPYPQELRDRVLAACDDGMKTQPVARTFRVSPAWVRRIKQRRREEGRTTPKPMGGATVVKIDLVRLGHLVDEQPDATLAELRQRLDCGCGASAVCMALQRLGLSLKKKRSTPRSRTGPMSPKPGPTGSKRKPPTRPDA